MSGKGGARNFVKSFIDPGILLEALSKHQDLLQKFGTYDKISRNQSLDPKGLFSVLPLIRSVLEISPSGDIHSAAVRQVLLRMVTDKPSLNNSEWNGQIFCNLRAERLNVVLYHFRRLKSKEEVRKCAAKLTASEFQQLQAVVDMLDAPAEAPQEDKKRKLKQEVSDATLDSDGYPKCLETPSPKPKKVSEAALAKGKGSPTASLAPSFLRRRKGSQVDNGSNQEHDPHLAAAMGFGGGKHALVKGKFGKALLKGKGKKHKPKKQKVPSKRSPKGQLPTALVPRPKDSHGTSFS